MIKKIAKYYQASIKRSYIPMLFIASNSLAHALEMNGTIEKNIIAQLTAANPNVVISSITESPIASLYEIKMKNSQQVIFSDSTGDFFIVGEMYQIKNNKLINLQKPQRIADLVTSISLDDIITYQSSGKTKHSLYIFTDVDCPYCVKLHKELEELNKNGVSVHYLAYPRSGLYTPSYSKIASAWCATDPKTALPKIQQGEFITFNDDCDSSVIDQHFSIGNQIGVSGTPTIVFSDGRMISGYHSAADLLKMLQR